MSKKVFVSGCYDIIHGGHVEFFNQAKNVGGPDAYLIVSFASDEVLLKYKNRKSSLPQEHKKRLLEAMAVVDEVVIGTRVDDYGIDFTDHFMRIKPDYLVVTEDDKYSKQKQGMCNTYGGEYVVLPKTLHYEKISTTDIVKWIQAPKEVPLRVDFAGGWLDVPKYSHVGGYIVNCSIQPKVSLVEWPYNIKSGLGGSGAYSILTGADAIQSELDLGCGWQDPAIINETGLCVWVAGSRPRLDIKINPEFLNGRMALYWTGHDHDTPNNVDLERNYQAIQSASMVASRGVWEKCIATLANATSRSYYIQLEEGMERLPESCEIAKKYCGGGWGGYALYLFDNKHRRDMFCKEPDTIAIEPYMK